ncbi:MAG: histidine kinase [Candidatus Tectimicrobiota bacterium]|nr:MAG: histidine kinase [Candidatus Tectomicrobia bacterium]
MQDVFVGRQPIYDRQLDVFAYELLFRSGEANQARFVDGDLATSQVILNTFLEIGLDTIVGQKRAFINLTRGFLLQDCSHVFPAKRVVLEVLEDVHVDAELLAAVRRLAAAGYTIALDDFVYHERLRPLVELADIVKVDVLALDRETLREHVARLRPYGVRLLAEKVETQDDFAYCKDLGFDYFQGYFFCKPDVVRGQRRPANRLTLLQLLARLQDPEMEFGELEALVSRDVVLSYKLLRVVNAAFYGTRKVDSLHQALLLLGTRVIASWASMILLAGIDDKPHELMLTALVRAKMCELLALATAQANPATSFTVGLFSALDALLDAPMADILRSLPLTEEVARALLAHEGLLGQTLRCVLGYERGAWDDMPTLGLPPHRVRDAYLQALHWATETSSLLSHL